MFPCLFRRIFPLFLICSTQTFADVLVDVVRWDMTRSSGVLVTIDSTTVQLSRDDDLIQPIPIDEIAFISMNTTVRDLNRSFGVLMMIDTYDETLPVTIQAIDDSSIQFSREDGRMESVPFRKIDFISMDVESKVPKTRFNAIRSTGSVRLVDGGVLTGKPKQETGGFTWRNWWTGPITMPLEEISSFTRFEASQRIESSNVDDVVSLSNGDRISGFVDSIENGIITLEKEDGTVLEIPQESIDQAFFANRVTPTSGPALWTTLGDRLVVDSISYDQNAGFIIGKRPMSQDLIGGFVFENDRITPLSSRPITLHETPKTPRYHLPRPVISRGANRMDASIIELKGPLRAEWKLQSPGLRFVSTLVVPQASRRHAEMEIRILDGDELLVSFEMDSSNPTMDVSVRISGEVLTLEVLDSGGGPIMDQIEIHEALLFSPTE